jgi:hypothetical protein
VLHEFFEAGYIANRLYKSIYSGGCCFELPLEMPLFYRLLKIIAVTRNVSFRCGFDPPPKMKDILEVTSGYQLV